MGFFGEDKTEEIQGLKEALRQSNERRKELAAALAAEQRKVVAIQADIDAGKAELEKMKAALIRAKQRQKASVDRSNRYKSRLATVMTTATVNL
jgi:hypothetical protein